MTTHKNVLVIQHSDVEDLGCFEPVLRERGCTVTVVRAEEIASQSDDADLVIVLGGNMGAYETDEYPFLTDEIAFLARRLEAEKPTLGICLGAQLMAEALGGRASKGKSKVIGFRPIQITEAGKDSPLRHFASVPVFQWHGDSFRLPAGATRLASSAEYSNEAFRMGDYALAIQFHAELCGDRYERWIASGEAELAAENVDADELRARCAELSPASEDAARLMLAEWFDTLDT